MESVNDWQRGSEWRAAPISHIPCKKAIACMHVLPAGGEQLPLGEGE